MVRCFVGVFLPEEIKAYILSLQELLRKMGLDCKFVEEENIHISMSFIGDVDDESVEVLKKSLDEFAYPKFPVSTGSVKLIPSEKFVRVIAVDVVGRMSELQDAVVKKVGGDAKPPHITLCRVRSPLNPSQVENIKSLVTNEVSFTVDSVDLVKSVVTRSGPVYESILKINLR